MAKALRINLLLAGAAATVLHILFSFLLVHWQSFRGFLDYFRSFGIVS